MIDIEPNLKDSGIGKVVEGYLRELRAGTNPAVEEYVSRHPEIAEVLRRILPSLTDPIACDAEAVTIVPGKASAQTVDGTLGDYRLIREIGRGGMGIVHEAVQISLGRRVALKVLPFAAAMDSRQLQRFKNEAQAAAQLHHGNIVPVYAVGCERGVYYYAMQYIDGQSLADLLGDLRRASEQGALLTEMVRRVGKREFSQRDALGSSDSQPTDLYTPAENEPVSVVQAESSATTSGHSIDSQDYFRTIAGLGVQAAEALQHAHDQGVVHRDVKPGNLLLDPQGKVWVTDFGLARFQSDAGLTLTGDLMGTLRYMSPEQALGQWNLVDHRTDVYALGATLYELLTLQPVFDGRDRQQLLSQISFQEVRPARQLNRSIPGDLEVILMKSLAKAREDRYLTAGQMAEDLRRYLEHQPILAKRPTVMERASKWGWRHRRLVAAVVVVMVLACVGLASSTVMIAQEQSRTKEAYEKLREVNAVLQKSKDELKALYSRAEENFDQARQIVDLFTRVTEQELRDRPELRAMRKTLLEAALGFYQKFAQQCADDPDRYTDLLASQSQIASILREMGQQDAAWEVQYDALNQCRQQAQYESNSQEKQALITSECLFVLGLEEKLMLLSPQVRQELQLSSEQVNRISCDVDRNARAMTKTNRESCVQQLRSAIDKSIEAELTARQVERLHQIMIQSKGTQAFLDQEIIKRLELSEEQVAEIRGILSSARANRIEFWVKNGTRQMHFGDICTATKAKVLAVLTDEQRARWNEIVGESVQWAEAIQLPHTGNDQPRRKDRR